MNSTKKIIGLLFVAVFFLNTTHTNAQEPMLGEIKIFAGNFPPRGWAFCDGQLLPIASNSALFSILGTMYGGDGRTTFALPDLRGRVAIGPRSGPGLPDYRQAQKGGAPTTVLTQNNLPSHTHIINASNAYSVVAIPALADAADVAAPAMNSVLATGEDSAGGEIKNYNSTDPADTHLAPFRAPLGGTISAYNTGSNTSFSNMQPYLPINYIIALQGIFPSRQ
ncbi:phage tail protein [Tenacibaculum sp. 190524A02b]|uniref:Phage tail protein n=1 Tax=Tenacibaculum vairaonense TaxID=3137860 RepID=A0ABM9PHR0_9FLAO